MIAEGRADLGVQVHHGVESVATQPEGTGGLGGPDGRRAGSTGDQRRLAERRPRRQMSQRDLGARPIPEDPGRAVGEHVEAVGRFELTDDLVTEVEPDGPEHLTDEGTQVLGDEEHEGNLVEDGRAGVLGDLDLWHQTGPTQRIRPAVSRSSTS